MFSQPGEVDQVVKFSTYCITNTVPINIRTASDNRNNC